MKILVKYPKPLLLLGIIHVTLRLWDGLEKRI